MCSGLKQLRSKGSDVIVFHLLDRDELEFPFEDSTLFEDLEEDLKLLADPPAIRSAYKRAIENLIEGYRQSALPTASIILFSTPPPA